jgi:MFS family permease
MTKDHMFLREFSQRTISFARRQTHDFKLMVGRRALQGIAAGLSTQYDSIYATLLGADAVQLGSLRSVGNAIGAVAALPAGWFIDYYSLKNVLLLSVVMLAASKWLYFAAPQWNWLYAGVILYYLGLRLTCTSCTVVCAAELENQERATGRGLCRTISSTVAIVTPILAAGLVAAFGGVRASGLRPLYAIQILVFVAMFILLLTRLSASRIAEADRAQVADGRHLLASFAQVFDKGPDVARLMLVMGFMELPWTLAGPFVPLYAHQFKGADEFLLGGISTASAVVPLLASIPLGRLADRHGRKRLLFAIAPLSYAANLCLVYAPPSGAGAWAFLLVYGVLFGFNSISMALTSSMAAEIMPKNQMGRWIGIVSLFRGLLAIPAPLIGGVIWEHVGPQYTFLAAIAVDLLLRLPLLGLVRETLHLPSDHQNAAQDQCR